MGVSFYAPEDWEYVDNNKGSGIVEVGLKVPPTRYEIDNVTFSISYKINNENLTAEQYGKKDFSAIGYGENGEMTVAGKKAYYFINSLDHPNTDKFTTIYVSANSMIYRMTYGGEKNLYNQYYKTFEKMLETLQFNTPTYIEELGGNVSGSMFNTQDNVTDQRIKKMKNEFIGVWQFFENPSYRYPAFELIINDIDNEEVNFDFIVYGIASFENQTATLYSDGVSSVSYSYSIKTEDNEEMNGMIFFNSNDGVDFTIFDSDPESFEHATIPFTIKSNTSLLK